MLICVTPLTRRPRVAELGSKHDEYRQASLLCPSMLHLTHSGIYLQEK